MRKLLCVVLTAALCLTCVVASGQTSQGVTKLAFPNGFRLIVKQEQGKGLVALSMVVRAGVLEEGDTPGVGQVLARALMTGARNLSPRKLAQLADEVGGSFTVTWDQDYTEIAISTTSAQIGPALELLAETLIDPRLDPAVIQTSREQVVGESQSGKDSAFRQSYDALRRLLYRTSPYRRPLVADADDLEAVTPAAVKSYMQRWFVPSNMVLAVVGDISPEQTRDAAKTWFGRLKPAAVPPRAEVTRENGPMPAPRLLEMDSVASYVVAGALASGLSGSGYAADFVAATALGGGKASRMFQDIREGQGLVYELGTLYPPLLNQSHVVAYVLASPYVATGPHDAQPSVEVVRSALKAAVDSLRERPVSELELARAKSYIVGSFALRHQRLSERAKHLAWFEALGLGYGYDEQFPALVNAVTLEQARRSAESLFERSAMVVLVPKEQ